MTDFINKIKKSERFISARESTVKFLNGNLYPLFVAAFVLIGHITALEFYFNIPIIISASIGLFISPTIKPFLIGLTTFLYQIPFKHTPADFTYPYVPERDYYSQPVIIAVLIILGTAVFAAIIYRFIKYSARNIGRCSPLFYPVAFLSLSFLLNGVFGGRYTVSNLFFALVQIAIYFFLFYLLYYGLRDIPKGELISYISYIALLNSLVLVGELAFIYLTYDNLFVDGSIVKEAINFGWAVANPAGFVITSLIPMIALGAITGRRPALWLCATVVTWLGAFLTMSRNAMLFSTLTLIVCLIYGCIRGNSRRLFRITLAIGAVCAVLVSILFFDKLSGILKNIIDMGTNDNGRFGLWGRALELFLTAPVFGVGFFGFGDIGTSTYIAILPTMAHNTLLILMSSMGIFGTVCFIWYRVRLLYPLTKKRTHEKSMLLITFLSVIAMCMLDNHVFYIYTMFYFIILQCAAVRLCEDGDPTDTPCGSDATEDTSTKAK